jgi:putative phosphoribosyl transferase
MQVFDNRAEAGRRLAIELEMHPAVVGAERLVVLAVPRGGLPVGAEVARALGAELDVVVARKLRTPTNPELGFGAVGADGHVEVDRATMERLGITEEQLDAEIADRREAVHRRLTLYRSVAAPVDLQGAVVVVVDDGIATGGTSRQACALARRGGAATVVLAVPVAPVDTAQRLADAADAVVVLSSPAEFLGVSQAYAEFEQLDDEAAVTALQSVSRTG